MKELETCTLREAMNVSGLQEEFLNYLVSEMWYVSNLIACMQKCFVSYQLQVTKGRPKIEWKSTFC